MFDLSKVRVFKNFDKNSKNWHRWLWEAFVFFYLLLKKSVTTLCFKLSIRSRSNNLSMFSTREWISSSCILKMERSCSVSNASTTSLVEGRVGSLFSSSSWSSSLSSFSLSIIRRRHHHYQRKKTTTLFRSANDSAERFGWIASLSNSCDFSRSSCKLLNGSSSSFAVACCFDWLMLDFLTQQWFPLIQYSMMIPNVSLVGEY